MSFWTELNGQLSAPNINWNDVVPSVRPAIAERLRNLVDETLQLYAGVLQQSRLEVDRQRLDDLLLSPETGVTTCIGTGGP